MDTSRAREVLGWSAKRSSVDALLELFDGIGEGAGAATPPLHARGTEPPEGSIAARLEGIRSGTDVA